jgi:methylisocitrate lyase
MAARRGFEALYMSGGATSALTGVPDIGLLGVEAFAAKVHNLARSSGLPVLADADTGFKDVVATVHAFAAAGASGVHLEDQVFPKRCGHLSGKAVVPTADFAAVIARAAHAARTSQDPDFIVCARSDARGVDGGNVAQCIDRLRAYLDAGAAMAFPEGLQSEGEFAEVATALRASHGESEDGGPFLLANMTEFGVSPLLSSAELGAHGYDLAIFPVGLLRVAMKAVDNALGDLLADGSLETLANEEGGMLTRAELYALLQYDPSAVEPWDYSYPRPPPAPRETND